MCLTTEAGVITHANRTLCHWLGRELSELLGGVRIQDLMTVGARIFHQTHWLPLLQLQGSVSEVKLDIFHHDGHKIPFVLNALRRVDDGVVSHELALFIAVDRHKYEHELLEARRRAEELLRNEQQARQELRLAQDELGRVKALAEDRAMFAEQMVAIVSHDLRNPLSAIRMSAHSIGNGDLTQAQQRALARLISSNERAARLITDVLDFSQARTTMGLQMNMAAMDLHEVVAEGLEDLRLSFPGRLLVHRRIGSGLIVGSSDRIVQLIGNLVANAMTYGAVDRPVLVTSAIDATQCAVNVQNHGPIISAEMLPTLFDPMTRGHAGSNRSHSVGLGLFIARAIAEAHRGTIAVSSCPVDGTTFSVEIPRIEAPEGAASH